MPHRALPETLTTVLAAAALAVIPLAFSGCGAAQTLEPGGFAAARATTNWGAVDTAKAGAPAVGTDAPEAGILAASNLASFAPESLHPARACAPAAVPAPQKVDEEFWVIEAAGGPGAAPVPCLGTLEGVSGGKREAFRAKKAAVRPALTATVATVTVEQEFANPFDETVDAEYRLTMPPEAVASDFTMTFGSRRVRALVRDRASAERLYRAAKGQGLPVTLAKAGQPLTVAVGNVEPGKTVAVAVQYVQPLAVRDGALTFALGTRGADDGRRHLRGETATALDLTFAGLAVEKVESDFPLPVWKPGGPFREAVTLVSATPPRDYRVTFTVAGDAPKAALLVHRAAGGTYFAVSVVAPAGEPLARLTLRGREIGEVKLPDVAKGRSLLAVGRLAAGRDVRDLPRLLHGAAGAAIPLAQVDCPALPSLWAKAQYDGLAGDRHTGDSHAAARRQVALEHGLLTDDTAVLAVDTTSR